VHPSHRLLQLLDVAAKRQNHARGPKQLPVAAACASLAMHGQCVVVRSHVSKSIDSNVVDVLSGLPRVLLQLVIRSENCVWQQVFCVLMLPVLGCMNRLGALRYREDETSQTKIENLSDVA
jgi:hypothetical protein